MGFPWIECLVTMTMGLHVMICPYSKVEESFNIQAIHDIIHYGTNISQYDHLQFPGVVPRSFLGSLVIAVVSSPIVYLISVFNVPKIYEQYVVRLCLGNAVTVGLILYAAAVKEKFGKQTGQLMLLVTVTQFHFMFYASRTLPNTFALVFVLLALRAWLKKNNGTYIWLSGAAILIFRSELALLLGIFLLLDLVYHRVSILTVIKWTIPAGIILLLLTFCVDSWFWQRHLWPEGEVLWYNTILNKSSDWGTSPFLWYFYSCLPRALSCSIVLVPVGLFLSKRVRHLVIPALTFVFLYSFLPHKELRFIIYVIPICNTAVAEAIHLLWIKKEKSFLWKLLAFGALIHLCVNLCTTGMFLYTSHHNYPGGQALYRLHQRESPNSDVHVHIDVAAAQTGVTRFGQMYQNWIYNKTEDLKPGGPDMMSYTHLMIGDPAQLPLYENTHTIFENILGYDGINIDRNKFPFLSWRHKPKMWILKRKAQN